MFKVERNKKTKRKKAPTGGVMGVSGGGRPPTHITPAKRKIKEHWGRGHLPDVTIRRTCPNRSDRMQIKL